METYRGFIIRIDTPDPEQEQQATELSRNVYKVPREDRTEPEAVVYPASYENPLPMYRAHPDRVKADIDEVIADHRWEWVDGNTEMRIIWFPDAFKIIHARDRTTGEERVVKAYLSTEALIDALCGLLHKPLLH